MKILLLVLCCYATKTTANSEITSGINQFAAAFYKNVLDQNKNFLFSPVSAEIVLALAQLGAQGGTAEELQSALYLPNNKTQTQANFKKLLEILKTPEQKFILEIANKLYLQQGFSIKKDFEKVATEVFHAQLENLDFSQNLQSSQIINKWVEEQTQNKIKDLISADSLSSSTRAVLINALYLKANWSIPFEKLLTSNESFFKNDQTEIKASFLRMRDDDQTFKYAENTKLGAKFLELPLAGEDISMVFVLPNDHISKLESKMEEVFQPQKYTNEYVNISIPKFKIETSNNIKNVLQKLGVSKAFSELEADFSGISNEKIAISEAIQKTFINVDENGVEAAAASYIHWTFYSLNLVNYKEFQANRPFIFYIQVKNVIVLVGKILEPKY